MQHTQQSQFVSPNPHFLRNSVQRFVFVKRTSKAHQDNKQRSMHAKQANGQGMQQREKSKKHPTAKGKKKYQFISAQTKHKPQHEQIGCKEGGGGGERINMALKQMKTWHTANTNKQCLQNSQRVATWCLPPAYCSPLPWSSSLSSCDACDVCWR